MFKFVKNWWLRIDWKGILDMSIAYMLIGIALVLVFFGLFFTLKFVGKLLHKSDEPESTYAQLKLLDGTLIEGEVEYSNSSMHGNTFWVKLKGNDTQYTIDGANVIFFEKK